MGERTLLCAVQDVRRDSVRKSQSRKNREPVCIVGIHVIGDNGHARQVNSGKVLSSCSDFDGSFSLYVEQEFSGAGDADSRDELTKKSGCFSSRGLGAHRLDGKERLLRRRRGLPIEDSTARIAELNLVARLKCIQRFERDFHVASAANIILALGVEFGHCGQGLAVVPIRHAFEGQEHAGRDTLREFGRTGFELTQLGAGPVVEGLEYLATLFDALAKRGFFGFKFRLLNLEPLHFVHDFQDVAFNLGRISLFRIDSLENRGVFLVGLGFVEGFPMLVD